MLTHRERRALARDGMKAVTILKTRWYRGGPDYLLEAMSDHQPWRGWYNHGESLADIRWQEETLDGWPAEVCV